MRTLCLVVVATACAAPPAAQTQPIVVPEPRPAPAAPVASAPSSVKPVLLDPAPIDTSTLVPPATVWSVTTAPGAPSRTQDHGVLVILPNAAGAALIDADTGKPRWTSHARAHERWTAVTAATEGTARAVFVTDDHGGTSIVRLDRSTGKVLARRIAPAGSTLQKSERGGLALVDPGHCSTSVVDVGTGAVEGAPIPGTQVEIKDFQGRRTTTCRNTVALHAWLDGVELVSFLDGVSLRLAGIGPNGEVWRHDVAGQVLDLLDVGEHDALFAGVGVTAGASGSVLRVEAATGHIEVVRDLPADPTCAERTTVRFVPPGVLLQQCSHVQLLDAHTAATIWTADAPGFAIIEGEPLREIDIGHAESVQWLAASGSAIAEVALPSGAERVIPVGAAIDVVTNDNAIAQIAQDGRVRWQYRVPAGQRYLRDDKIVIADVIFQLWIDSSTGKVDGTTAGTPWSPGRAAVDPGLWLAARHAPDELIAVRLAP